MEFCILGSLEVRDGERVVELPRQKPRALLACLLLQAGRPVSVDRLIEGLWGESAPATARTSLQNFVSQLRRAIGADALPLRPGGYVLDVDPGAVDLVRFERLVERSRRESGRERVETLRLALALWRGPPLADLTFEPFALAEVPRLEELLTNAQEDLIDAELESGLLPERDLVPRIEALVARNPLRERLRGQLMLALYRSDRQAEALAAYQGLRRALVDELGIEPSPDIRELEQAILRQEPALAPAHATSRPVRREARMLATVLFAELTVCEAPPGLDPEALRGIGARSLAELRAATEYHGGSVGRASGEELLAVFTGHEDDALRAARSALQMQRATRGPPPEERAPRVEVRTALTTGRLILTGAPGLSDADGHAVGLARRLAATAAAGEVLLDAATAEAADAGLTATRVEPRTVRGEAGPVDAFRLLDAEPGPVPRPGGTAPLVGRERDLDLLRAAFDEIVTARRCRLVVVAGEAGMASRASPPSSQPRWGTGPASSSGAACRTGRARPTGRCARSSSRRPERIRGPPSSGGSPTTSARASWQRRSRVS